MAKRQASNYLLVSLLLYGLTWCGLLTAIVAPVQDKPLNTLSNNIPFPDQQNHQMSLPLWQLNSSDAIFPAEIVSRVTFNKGTPGINRNTGNVSGNNSQNAVSKYTRLLFCAIDCYDAYKYADGQTYLLIDIPPPHTSAYL